MDRNIRWRKVTSISAEISTFNGGAKEAQNFNLKVHSDPSGSVGSNHDEKEGISHKIILKHPS